MDIPYGYCHCGCGEKTNLAPYSSKRIGWIKGEPLRYINFHCSNRKPDVCIICNVAPRRKVKGKPVSYCGKCKYKIEREKYPYRKTRDRKRKDVFILSNSYIKSLITRYHDINYNDIPTELIEIQRAYLKLRRMVRKTKLKGELYVDSEGHSGSVDGTR